MTSKHFSKISLEPITNEALARVLGGSWLVVYCRDGELKSHVFHTVSVATAFALKLEAGELDDDALLGKRATPEQHADMLRVQNAELTAVLRALRHEASRDDENSNLSAAEFEALLVRADAVLARAGVA